MKLIAAAFLLTINSASSFISVLHEVPPPRSPSSSTLLFSGQSGAANAAGESLDSVLKAKCSDAKVRQIIHDMLGVCGDITNVLRSVVDGSADDEQQLSVDVSADNLIWDAVKASSVVREGASEALPSLRNVDDGGDGEFTVCWDPLDARSIDWALETLIGIWPNSTGFLGATGADQVTSIVALYGPSKAGGWCTALVALDDGTYEFSYGCSPEKGDQLPKDKPSDSWVCTRKNIQIGPDAKLFSLASLKAAQDLPAYRKLIDHVVQNRYTLRQDSDGLVPDVFQAFTKRQGNNPATKAPKGRRRKSPTKLRLAFEAAPFGLLVEKAGGKTSDGVTGGSILDVEINAVDQRTAFFVGPPTSSDEDATATHWSAVPGRK